MEMFVVIYSCGAAISLIIMMFMLTIITNINLYCAIFKYKDRRLWKFLIENVNNFKVIYNTQKSILLEWDGYELFVRKNNELVSVHKNDECILSYFDEKMSKKTYNTLKELGKI